METILTKIYTQEELDSNYDGDTLQIDNELKTEFVSNNPEAIITGTIGESSDNGDDTFTYTLTIEYEL